MTYRFTRNVGRLDQILRLGISLILIYLGFVDELLISDPLSSSILGAIGILNAIVALAQHCPVYSLAGINTLKKE